MATPVPLVGAGAMADEVVVVLEYTCAAMGWARRDKQARPPKALERRDECILVVLETRKRVNSVNDAVLEIKEDRKKAGADGCWMRRDREVKEWYIYCFRPNAA